MESAASETKKEAAKTVAVAPKQNLEDKGSAPEAAGEGQKTLKACPFCGKDAATSEFPHPNGKTMAIFCVDVDDCGAEIQENLGKGATYSMDDLKLRWNRRAAPSV